MKDYNNSYYEEEMIRNKRIIKLKHKKLNLLISLSKLYNKSGSESERINIESQIKSLKSELEYLLE